MIHEIPHLAHDRRWHPPVRSIMARTSIIGRQPSEFAHGFHPPPEHQAQGCIIQGIQMLDVIETGSILLGQRRELSVRECEDDQCVEP